jgi:hypothetical protein
MQEAVAGYAGPHKVVLNRNESNLGVGGHINLLLEKAAGELIVLAAGDDISAPERVSRTVALWLDNDRKFDSIWTKATLIDAQGRATGQWASPPSSDPLHQQVAELIPALVGCSQATTKRMLHRFGPLPRDVVIEDKCLGFRALVSGGCGYVDEPLVRYRIHGESISNAWRFAAGWRGAQRLLTSHKTTLGRRKAVFESFLRDLDRLKDDDLDPMEKQRTLDVIARRMAEDETERLIAATRLPERMKGFIRGCFTSKTSLRHKVRYVIMLFSPRVAFAIAALLAK